MSNDWNSAGRGLPKNLTDITVVTYVLTCVTYTNNVAVVTDCPASPPNAILLLPAGLLKSAETPTAALFWPVVVLMSALAPIAVLFKPAVLFWSSLTPVAVLASPVMFASSACQPVAVLSCWWCRS